jgi:hypothetical protein
MSPDVAITRELVENLSASADEDGSASAERLAALLAALDDHAFDLWPAAADWLNGD